MKGFVSTEIGKHMGKSKKILMSNFEDKKGRTNITRQ